MKLGKAMIAYILGGGTAHIEEQGSYVMSIVKQLKSVAMR